MQLRRVLIPGRIPQPGLVLETYALWLTAERAWELEDTGRMPYLFPLNSNERGKDIAISTTASASFLTCGTHRAPGQGRTGASGVQIRRLYQA